MKLHTSRSSDSSRDQPAAASSAAASASSGSGDGHTAMSGAVVAGADASLHTPQPADGVPIRIRKT